MKSQAEEAGQLPHRVSFDPRDDALRMAQAGEASQPKRRNHGSWRALLRSWPTELQLAALALIDIISRLEGLVRILFLEKDTGIRGRWREIRRLSGCSTAQHSVCWQDHPRRPPEGEEKIQWRARESPGPVTDPGHPSPVSAGDSSPRSAPSGAPPARN